MRRVSIFLRALAEGISDDLREHVAPDKLQYEVEVELESQVLAQLVTKVSEYNNARNYYKSDMVKQNQKRNEVLRFMGYCNEMWVKTDEVKGVITSGDLSGVEEVELN